MCCSSSNKQNQHKYFYVSVRYESLCPITNLFYVRKLTCLQTDMERWDVSVLILPRSKHFKQLQPSHLTNQLHICYVTIRSNTVTSIRKIGKLAWWLCVCYTENKLSSVTTHCLTGLLMVCVLLCPLKGIQKIHISISMPLFSRVTNKSCKKRELQVCVVVELESKSFV